jgi:hypothetical protein
MSRRRVTQQFTDENATGAGWAVADRRRRMLREHVGGYEQAEEKDQRGGDEQLRGEAARAVAVDLRAGRAADRAAPLDDRTGTMRADQVLTAHLGTPSGGGATAHLE